MRVANLKGRILLFFANRISAWADSVRRTAQAAATRETGEIEEAEASTRFSAELSNAGGAQSRRPPEDWANRVSSGPPQHWLDLVRSRAPQLLSSEGGGTHSQPTPESLDRGEASRNETARTHEQRKPNAPRKPLPAPLLPPKTVRQRSHGELREHSASKAARRTLRHTGRLILKLLRPTVLDRPEQSATEEGRGAAATGATESERGRAAQPVREHVKPPQSAKAPATRKERLHSYGAQTRKANEVEQKVSAFNPEQQRTQAAGPTNQDSQTPSPIRPAQRGQGSTASAWNEKNAGSSSSRTVQSGRRDGLTGEHFKRVASADLESAGEAFTGKSFMEDGPWPSTRNRAEKSFSVERQTDSSPGGDSRRAAETPSPNIYSPPAPLLRRHKPAAGETIGPTEKRSRPTLRVKLNGHGRASRPDSSRESSPHRLQTADANMPALMDERATNETTRFGSALSSSIGPDENPWPELPETSAPEMADELATIRREAERLQRLEREQRGTQWNA